MAITLVSTKTLVHDSPLFQLFVEYKEPDKQGLVMVEVTSVWPQTRQKENSVPHRMLQLHLPKESMDKLGKAILGE